MSGMRIGPSFTLVAQNNVIFAGFLAMITAVVSNIAAASLATGHLSRLSNLLSCMYFEHDIGKFNLVVVF